MRTGIMGGTFNPVHNAHLLIAQKAQAQYGLNRIIFITSGNPPHKTAMTDARHRFNMTRLAISDNSSFIDDDFEVNRSEKSYTLYTLEYLKKKYPEDELFFIIGEDSLEDLPKWYKPEKILALASVLVFPRKSEKSLLNTISEIKTRFDGDICPIDAPVTDISSTQIRECILNGENVREMLPRKVLGYIEENGLYVR